MTGFQTAVNTLPAPGVEGEIASANPTFTVLAGPGGLVAGADGVTVGRFAWFDNGPQDLDNAPQLVNSYGSGAVAGFVRRELQSIITTFLDGASMVVPSGFPVTLYSSGDFWAKNNGATFAHLGDSAYAAFADGSVSFALGGATATAWSIAAATATFTGAIAGNVLTAGTVTGAVYPGSIVTGAGVATGTAVGDQLLPLLSGELLGGAGRYYVSIGEQAIAAEAITLTYGLLTLTTVTAGTFAVGQTLTGATAGVTAGTSIRALITGAGGSGTTAAVNLTQTSGNGGQGDLTGATNVATKWFARSAGAAGELVKISAVPLG